MKRYVISALLTAAIASGAAASTPATFPGGQEALDTYLGSNVKYPVFAQENGIEGTVTVDFTVSPDGTVTGVKIARPLDPDLEAEAIRVVKAMPAWVPATDDAGAPVTSTVSLPVKFRLTH